MHPKPLGEGLHVNCEDGNIDPKIYLAIHESKLDARKIKVSGNYSLDNQLLSLKAKSALNSLYFFLNRKLVEDRILDINDEALFGWLSKPILNQILNLK